MNTVFWYFGLYFMVFQIKRSEIQHLVHKVCRIWYQNKGNLINFTKKHHFAHLVVLDMPNAIKRGSSFYAASMQQ